MYKLLWMMVGLLILVVGLFYVLGFISRTGQATGLVNDKLSICPNKPNCVCSQYPADKEHYIEPLPLGETAIAEAWFSIKTTLIEMGGILTTEQDDYLAFTFTSLWFGFTDDVEVKLDAAQRLIHLRSASRVGYSDRGVNSERIATLKARLTWLRR